MAEPSLQKNILQLVGPREKIARLELDIERVWRSEAQAFQIPVGTPGRDIKVEAFLSGEKNRIGKIEGQAQLLRGLENIELQAV